jgi:homoserine O-acetyltransferase
MGGALSRARLLGHADRHRRPPFAPRTSPSTRSAARRSWPIPNGAAATIWRQGTRPSDGLAVARMAAHITYLSDAALHRKFGRRCRTATRRPSPSTPISRSRAICATRARPSSSASTPTPISMSRGRWTISTSPRRMAGSLARAFAAPRRASASCPSPRTGCSRRRDSRQVVHALNAAGASVSLRRDQSDKGHDAFLLDEPELFAITRGFLESAARARGIA